MKQTVNVGTTANDGTGDPLRTAFTKLQANDDELYDFADAHADRLDAAETAITNLGNSLTELRADLEDFQFKHVDVDSASIGSAFANVPGLTFDLEADTTYQFDASVQATTDNTTTGVDIAVNGPATPSSLHYVQGRYSSTTGYLETVATAYDNDTGSTTSFGPTARSFRVRGIIRTGSTAGTFAIRIKREAVGTGPVVIAGSFGWVRKLF